MNAKVGMITMGSASKSSPLSTTLESFSIA